MRDELATPSSIEHVIFALRGAAAYEAFAAALSANVPGPAKPLLEPSQWTSVGPGRDVEGDALGAGVPAPVERSAGTQAKAPRSRGEPAG